MMENSSFSWVDVRVFLSVYFRWVVTLLSECFPSVRWDDRD